MIFPEGMKEIASLAFQDCRSLTGEVVLPSTIKKIGAGAFFSAKITKVNLPEGLEKVESYAFFYMNSLEEFVFPSTLKTLGGEACAYCRGLKRIYCAATVPPTCEDSPANPGDTPFGPYSGGELMPSNDIPVYVPIGTSELYRNAWGWNYFNNIIETDNFPRTTSIAGHVQEQEDLHPIFYDLTGKKINKPIKGRIYLRHGGKVLIR